MFGPTILLSFILGLAVTGTAPAPPTPQPPSALARAKLDAARQTYQAVMRDLPAARADAEKVYLWSRRVLEAQRDLSDKKAERIAALEDHLARMKELRKVALARYRAGHATHTEALAGEFYVAEAELWLAQAKTR
jgi:hypothetical protein